VKNNIEIVGVGSPVIDFVLEVDWKTIEQIAGKKGGMELVDSEQLQLLLGLSGTKPAKTLGGSAANTTFALTRLGMDCAFLGKLGDDRNGRYYQEQFKAIGGDCSRFKTDGNLPTACCVSLVTPDSERTLRTCLGATQTLTHSEIEPIDFWGCRHVHAEGYLMFNPDLLESILQTAKSVGCSVSLDLGSFEVVEASRDFLPRMLSDYVDIVFANEEEANAFSGSRDLQNSLDVLGKHCNVAAIKLAEDGAWLKSADETVKVSAATTDRLCDTTGAGDYWAAGFLYGYLNGYCLAKSGSVASLLGRHIVEHKGAVLPQSIWDRIILDTSTILNKKLNYAHKCQ